MPEFSSIHNYIENAFFSDLGSVASIISLFITIITLFLVKYIKKNLKLRFRISDQRNKLIKNASEISMLLNSYHKNEFEIYQTLALANVTLRALQKNARGSLLKDIKKARKKIGSYRLMRKINIKPFKPTKKHVREVYTHIMVVIEELQNLKEEFAMGN